MTSITDPTYKTDFGARAQVLLSNMKSRAKKKGLPFDLDYHWYMDKYEKGVCEASGIPFDEPEYNGQKGNTNPWVPSVDRIDNNKGYTKDNSRLVCYIFNIVKNRFTDEDFEKLARGFLVARAAERKRAKEQ